MLLDGRSAVPLGLTLFDLFETSEFTDVPELLDILDCKVSITDF